MPDGAPGPAWRFGGVVRTGRKAGLRPGLSACPLPFRHDRLRIVSAAVAGDTANNPLVPARGCQTPFITISTRRFPRHFFMLALNSTVLSGGPDELNCTIFPASNLPVSDAGS